MNRFRLAASLLLQLRGTLTSESESALTAAAADDGEVDFFDLTNLNWYGEDGFCGETASTS